MCTADEERGAWARRFGPGEGRTWHSSSGSVCGSVDQRREGLLVELYFFLVERRVRLQTDLLCVSVCRKGYKGCGKSQKSEDGA